MQIDVLFPNQNRYTRYMLGLYLKRKRTEAGLSVEEVAGNLDLASRTYRKLEAGQMKIAAKHFAILQDLLKLDADDLIEIRKIVSVQYINDLSQVLSQNYPA
jgi:transcriptional regulator with XRE-family HTH domain